MFMIGDSLNDMADARQANMQAILFDLDRHYANVTDEADEVVTELPSLVTLLVRRDKHA
jgi:phosphoglycolate phosphatase-like HAD superfamily hydrolase